MRAIGDSDTKGVAASRYLFDIAEELRARGFVCETATPHGAPAAWISTAAGVGPVDLVAMTTHGRSGPKRWLFGRVAESVVASSPVLVLVERAWQPIRREPLLADQPTLLVPLDGSAQCRGQRPSAPLLQIKRLAHSVGHRRLWIEATAVRTPTRSTEI